MWFTGRFTGAATVLVLEPSQVTGFPGDAGGCAAVASAAGARSERAGVAAEGAEDDADEPEAEALAEGDALLVAPAGAPSSLTPVPSLHAVVESAASTTAAAVPTRRVREFRIPDMLRCPFAVRVGAVLG
jgi:hypothetical protein